MTRASGRGERPELPEILPVLPLDGQVVFPYVIVPLAVAREEDVDAVDRALDGERLILLATRRPSGSAGDGADLCELATAGTILRLLKLPDGRTRILVQGLERVRVEHVSRPGSFLQAKVRPVATAATEADGVELEALVRSVREGLERVAALGREISPEVLMLASSLDDPGRLADLAASNLELDLPRALEILETLPPDRRLARVNDLLLRELQLLAVQEEISAQARGEMDRGQREYFLRQQLQAIQEELGEAGELAGEIAGYRRAVEAKRLPAEAEEELERQIRRLERTHPETAESHVVRTYLDWLTSMPWGETSDDRLDLERAERILDEDHYDLARVKERILEVLAVRRLNPASKGPILCFVGPPGVGKTSLGRSIARALGRRFVRVSLGGVRDEAEIRGHRRTYVGALPGRILQGIRQAGTANPVFMLDEIDKVGADARGDPASALLEVLDPEQNRTFRDHYLGLDYDLSPVLFITTANLVEPIQPAFLDRMEVIRISGYTAAEKVEIARRHLLPKVAAESGLGDERPAISAAALRHLIAAYTKEAGLRGLERELASLCRKVALALARGRRPPRRLTPRGIERLLGPARHFSDELLAEDRVGVATGLAWTAAGGDLLFVEVVVLPGRGRLHLTGQLGEVMRESAQAALSFARSRTAGGLDAEFFARHDIHVHVPAGSIPKDGPSAGITIATAVASAIERRPVRRNLAMSGEITLRGDVLPVGGLKEKILAARQAGVGEVALPRLNRRDLEQVDAALRRGVEFHLVEHMDEVLERALRPASPDAPTADVQRPVGTDP